MPLSCLAAISVFSRTITGWLDILISHYSAQSALIVVSAIAVVVISRIVVAIVIHIIAALAVAVTIIAALAAVSIILAGQKGRRHAPHCHDGRPHTQIKQAVPRLQNPI